MQIKENTVSRLDLQADFREIYISFFKNICDIWDQGLTKYFLGLYNTKTCLECGFSLAMVQLLVLLPILYEEQVHGVPHSLRYQLQVTTGLQPGGRLQQ
jgi:hypothetical protein